ncbi:hypothetical protein ES707_18212 [subsurface metagenome]
MMPMKLKSFEETRAFYKAELQKEELTEKERDKYLSALGLIEGFIGKRKSERDNKGGERE